MVTIRFNKSLIDNQKKVYTFLKNWLEGGINILNIKRGVV